MWRQTLTLISLLNEWHRMVCTDIPVPIFMTGVREGRLHWAPKVVQLVDRQQTRQATVL